MTVKLLTEQHLEFLSLTGGCTGLSESTLVKMPHCWKSHVVAPIFMFLNCYRRDLGHYHSLAHQGNLCLLWIWSQSDILGFSPYQLTPVLVKLWKYTRGKPFNLACLLTFHALVVICWLFFKINFYKKLFQEYYQSVKEFRSRSGRTLCWCWSGFKLFAKGYQQATKIYQR